jgi:hypothetical protein
MKHHIAVGTYLGVAQVVHIGQARRGGSPQQHHPPRPLHQSQTTTAVLSRGLPSLLPAGKKLSCTQGPRRFGLLKLADHHQRAKAQEAKASMFRRGRGREDLLRPGPAMDCCWRAIERPHHRRSRGALHYLSVKPVDWHKSIQSTRVCQTSTGTSGFARPPSTPRSQPANAAREEATGCWSKFLYMHMQKSYSINNCICAAKGALSLELWSPRRTDGLALLAALSEAVGRSVVPTYSDNISTSLWQRAHHA